MYIYCNQQNYIYCNQQNGMYIYCNQQIECMNKNSRFATCTTTKNPHPTHFVINKMGCGGGVQMTHTFCNQQNGMEDVY